MLVDQSEEEWRYRQPMKSQDWSYFGRHPWIAGASTTLKGWLWNGWLKHEVEMYVEANWKVVGEWNCFSALPLLPIPIFWWKYDLFNAIPGRFLTARPRDRVILSSCRGKTAIWVLLKLYWIYPAGMIAGHLPSGYYYLEVIIQKMRVMAMTFPCESYLWKHQVKSENSKSSHCRRSWENNAGNVFSINENVFFGLGVIKS